MTTATGLLKRAIEELEIHGEVSTWDLIKEIRDFLDAEPEAEPVAYLFDADSYCDHAPIKDELVQSLPKGMLRQKIKNVRPLYTRPEPARKPMTEDEVGEEILRNADEWSRNFANGFVLGIRFAEKHHGIRRG
jgi:hypothetical protein